MTAQDDKRRGTDPAGAPRSARVAYKAKLDRARTMLSTLSQLVDAHAIEFTRMPERWDLVSDLAQLNELLGRAAATIEKDRT